MRFRYVQSPYKADSSSCLYMRRNTVVLHRSLQNHLLFEGATVLIISDSHLGASTLVRNPVFQLTLNAAAVGLTCFAVLS